MRTPTILLAALFTACAPSADPGEAVDFPAVLPDAFEGSLAPAPSAADFQLVVGNLVAGARNTIAVAGAPPNTLVLLGYSPAGVGDGICPPSLRGACLGLRNPVTPLPFTLLTDAAGSASINLRLPASLAGVNVGMQAAITGPNAAVSNAVGRVVLQSGTALAPNADQDGDGFSINQGDCNDFNGQIVPGGPDTVGDGIDLNCDNSDGVDDDADAAASTASGGDDCDDGDDRVRPGAREVCDGVDNDCAGGVDDGACGVEDTFTVTAGAAVDVLMVLDDSCSMFEEQGRVGQVAGSFLSPLVNAGVDFHIGAVTTDMDAPSRSGRLLPVPSGTFLVPGAPLTTLISDFQALAQAGTAGSVDEQGRAATLAALTTPLSTGANAGFYRDDADLHVVVVSDENDYSNNTPDRASFISFMTGLKAPAYMSYFHTIVGPAAGCATADIGTEYLAVNFAVGGYIQSICDLDYTPIFTEIADDIVAAAGPPTNVYTLLDTPDPATIVVEADIPGIGTVTLDPSDYTHDPVTNTIRVTGLTLPAGTTLTVTYDL